MLRGIPRAGALTDVPERASDDVPAPVGRLTVEELYTRFAPTIYARCRQILRDVAAAEDATQEVFFRIQDHLAHIDGTRPALGWLYRAATNHCLNEVRNGQTHAVLLAAVPHPSGPDVEQRFHQRDLVGRLIRDLPEDLALIAWLYHVDELDQAEIAEICGVSRRTVIARLHRFAEQARIFLQSGER
ncbi:MAG TPA: sigma-70 family RNA polymerase sigma factor [Polyangia bacterium]|nr:sigma-70 family RNA polymerase sigma factor [Polyangia bacterium]